MFDLPDFDNHEAVVVVSDAKAGLRAIIAMHDTTLGPAHGGARYWTYDTPQEAIVDALRLSRGMTYKNAIAGLPFGGGKSVIMAEKGKPKTPELLEAFGAAVEKLGGRYNLAEDVGISPGDVTVIARRTQHVCGLPTGGDEAAADPGPFTARGVYLAMKAGLAESRGSAELAGVRVAVQGLGGVGRPLCDMLAAEGALLIISDVDAERAKRVAARSGAEVVAPDAIYDVDADVYAPCALGATLNADTIARLKVKLVCGGANNQLATAADGAAIEHKGILYLPDFVVNAGGVTHTTSQLTGWSSETVLAKIGEIPDRLRRILALAAQDGVDPQRAAEKVALEIIAKG
ncbi:Glu/Leu/Phe/Val family dehydrogenase [Sphingopyxis panaciterrae]